MSESCGSSDKPDKKDDPPEKDDLHEREDPHEPHEAISGVVETQRLELHGREPRRRDGLHGAKKASDAPRKDRSACRTVSQRVVHRFRETPPRR